MKFQRFFVLLTGLFTMSFILSNALAIASPVLNYNGRILRSDNTPLDSNSVKFRVQIWSSPTSYKECLLYEETLDRDLSNSNGLFSLDIGGGTKTTALGIESIFSNRGGINCGVTADIFNPSQYEGRILKLAFNDANDSSFLPTDWEELPAMPIQFVPQAIEALKIAGYSSNQLVKLAEGVSPNGSELNSTQWTEFLALINGTSAKYVKFNDTSSGFVGIGTSIPGSELDVKGEFRLSGSTSGYAGFKPAENAGSTVWTLPTSDGSSGQVLTTNGAGILSWTSSSGSGEVNTGNNIGGATGVGIYDSKTGPVLNYKNINSGASGKITVTDNVSQKTIDIDVNETQLNLSNMSGILPLAKGGTGATSQSAAANKILPPQTGYSGYFLTTDGSNVSWSGINASSLTSGTIGGSVAITTTGSIQTTNSILSGSLYSRFIYGDSISGSNLTLDSTSDSIIKGNIILAPNGGNVGIGIPDPSAPLEVKTKIGLRNSNGSSIELIAPTGIYSPIQLTLPSNPGASGYVLSTDGTGILNWVAPSGGGGGGITSLNGLTGGAQSYALGTSGTSPNWSSSGLIHTLNIPLASATGVAAGLISNTEYLSFSNKLDTSTTSGGDVSGTFSSITVNKIKGTAVSATAPADAGQVLRYDGVSTYGPAFLSLVDIRSTVTPANTMFPNTSCTNKQTLSWSSLTDTMNCINIQLSYSDISGLGNAATFNVGTAANNIVQLDASSKLPAVDGSQLTNISLNASNITTGTLSVTNGGTGTTNGSITGSGALTFAAGGSNQNVTLSPSGTGYTILNGNVDITGVMKLKIHDNTLASSLICDAGSAGTIALTAKFTTCVCNGTNWVLTADGSSTCIWQ